MKIYRERSAYSLYIDEMHYRYTMAYEDFLCMEFYDKSGAVKFVVCPIEAKDITEAPNPEFLYDAFGGMENGEAWYSLKQL